MKTRRRILLISGALALTATLIRLVSVATLSHLQAPSNLEHQKPQQSDRTQGKLSPLVTLPEPVQRKTTAEDTIAKAPIIESRTLPQDANGRHTKQKLVQWQGKYPLLRIEEDYEPTSTQPSERRFMVADHFIVKKQAEFTHDQLLAWVQANGLTIRRHWSSSDLYLIALPSGALAEFDASIATLNAPNSPIEYAEPDPLRLASSTPNDSLFPSQWALHNLSQTGGNPNADVDAPEAWNTTRGNGSLVVAVLDSGLDINHPDLRPNLWINTAEIPANNLDDDADGLIDNVNGWNFYTDNKDLTDFPGHGTHCAGIIGAVANNASGISGIAPQVKLMPLVVMDRGGFIVTSDAVAAMNFAVSKKVFITSNSYGGTQSSRSEKAAIDAALAQGILVVCAAGNDYPAKNIDTAKLYPASYSSANIISVAATTDIDSRAAFSNFGPSNVDLGAPGIGILSTLPNGKYGYESGTSMACPLVAGTCVLVKAAHPNLKGADIKSAILNSVDPLPGLKGRVKTGGRLNAARAIKIGTQPVIELSKTELRDAKLLGANGNNDGIFNAGEDITVATTIKNIGPFATADVATRLTLRQTAGDVTLLRDGFTWGAIRAGASMTNNTAKALPFLLRISPTAPAQQVTLVFTHVDSDGHTWTSETPFSIAGSHTLSGSVTLLTGGKPVKGATISYSGPVSGTTLTATDGTYRIRLPTGTYMVTASRKDYEPSPAQQITLPSSTAALNFTLGRSTLVALPAALSFKQQEQTRTTQTFTLTNKGDLPSNLTIQNSSLGNTIHSSFLNRPSYGAARGAQSALLPLPWQDGFESGTSSLVPSRYYEEFQEEDAFYIYTYIISYYLGSSSVVSNTAAVGRRSLHYRDPWFAGFDNGMQRRFAKATQPRYISYWVRPGSSTGTSGCFSLEDGFLDSSSKKWNWRPIISVVAEEGGKLSVNGSLPSGDSSVPFTPKAWHFIELRNINWTSRTFDYWVNGTQIKTAISFMWDRASAARVHIYNNTLEGESWWDELRVLDQDEVWLSHTPNTITLAPGASETVSVTANSENHRPGVFKAQLNCFSNDPVRPVLNVPVTMTVTPHPNTAPVVANQTVTIDEDTPTAIPLTITDRENDPFTVTLKTLPKRGRLSLTADGPPITSVPFNLTGANTVVYYTPPLNARGDKYASFSLQAKDYRLASKVATVTINIRSINDMPFAADDFAPLDAGMSSFTVNVLSNDVDRDGEPLNLIDHTQGAKGTVTLGSSRGQLIYTASPDFLMGVDSFQYTMADPAGATAKGTVWVTKASSVTATGSEDSDVSVTLTGPEANSGGTLTRIVTLPSQGTLFQTTDGLTATVAITSDNSAVTNGDGKVIFRPAPHGNGNPYTTFQFAIVHGATAAGAKATATFRITAVPDAPVAVNDAFSVKAGSHAKLNPLANDSEVDGETMSMTSYTLPASGTLTRNAQGVFDFTPDSLSGGSLDSFTYTLTDVTGLSTTATVSLRIKGASPHAWPTLGGDPDRSGNTPASLGMGSLSQQWSVGLGGALAQVAIAGGRVFVVRSATPAVIGLDAMSGGEIWRQSYQGATSINPPTWFGGKVYVQVQDGPGQTSHLVTFNESDGTIAWSSPFQQQWDRFLAPAVDESGAYVSGGTFGGMYGYEIDTGVQRFFVTRGAGSGATPTLHEEGLYTFWGGSFLSHNRASGAILWSNDLTNSFTAGAVACTDQTAYFIGGTRLNKLDLTTKAIIWSLGFNSLSGTPAVAPNSIFALAGRDLIEISKGTGELLRTYSTGSLQWLTTQPILTADTIVVASSSNTYLFNYGSTSPRQILPHGGEISVALGSIFIASSDGTVRRYRIADPNNPSPVASTAALSTLEDTQLTITLSATDASPLRFTVASLPAQGKLFQTSDGITPGAVITSLPTLVSDAQGRVLFQPALNSRGEGIGNFTFQAHDGNSNSNTATITVNVAPVNDPPTAIDDLITLRPGETLSGYKPQMNDRDVDDDTLTIQSYTQPEQGTVTPAANGGLSFVPNDSFLTGSTSFQYTIEDAANVISTAKVTIKLIGPSGLNWPTFGAGPDHTGYQPTQIGSATLRETWVNKVGNNANQVVVAEDRVFVTTPVYSYTTATVMAMEASTGGEIWRKTYPSARRMNPPTWHEGSLIYQVAPGGSEAASIVALRATDGAVQWSSPYSTQNETYLAPAVDSTGVYVNGGTFGGLYGYERSTGSQRFFQSLDQFDRWTPALHNGGLYSFVKGIFRSHSGSTGAVLWSKTFTWNWLGYEMNRTIACAGSSAFFINDSNLPVAPKPRELICLDLNRQEVRWIANSPNYTGTPALAHGCVYAYATKNTVNAYDATTGSLTAIFAAPSNANFYNRQPIITNDTVIVCDDSQTFLFDLQTRELRQTLPAGGSISLAGRSLYVASGDGNVRCYKAADPFNPAPFATSATVTTSEDEPVTLTLAANDSGTPTFTFVVTRLPPVGKLYQVTADGGPGSALTTAPSIVSDPQNRMIYVPPLNRSGSNLDSLNFKASDGNSLSDVATVTISVNPVNDAPRANSDTRQVRSGDILSPMLVLDNDSDVDGDSLIITSFTQPAHGVVAFNSDGTLRFESSNSISTGTDSFTYTVVDPSGAASTGTVNIIYNPDQRGQWPTFGNGPDHTGYAATAMGRGTLSQRWAYTTPAGTRQIAVAEGKVFAATIQNSLPVLVALHQETGAFQWSRSLLQTVSSYSDSINSPSYHNGMLYVQYGQQSSGAIAAINAVDGTISWTKPVGNQWSQHMAPAVNNLGVFINGGTYGGMYGFDLDGKQRFFIQLPQRDRWTPSLHNGNLYSYVGTFKNHSLTTGSINWELNNVGNDYSFLHRTVAFADESAFLVDPTYPSIGLVCVELTTQTILWREMGPFTGTPAVYNGIVYAINSKGSIQARSTSDGSLLKTFTLDSDPSLPVYAAPIITDELVIAAQSNKTLVFGRSDGVLLQTIHHGGEVAVVNDKLFISTATQVLAYASNPTITFSPAAGTFSSPQNITLIASDAGATIHYTTDGSAPNLSSATVASGGSVMMDHSGMLRAITVRGSTISRIIEATYTIGTPSAASAMAFKNSSSASGLSDSLAAADFDKDGRSDLAEAVAGTDPRNPSDFFKINRTQVLAPDGTKLSISWPSKVGRNYRVQCSNDLQTWLDISPSIHGIGTEITHQFAPPSSGPCFLRVRIE